ncbi:hypothetical protein L2E82_06747 [Cichorium intybus]|uniref:Uncharacterized protein n=1 Tax=Cichorium intybus TaxID=13427 RepID=A0ACB9HBZ7_CICIN|nr:hypothetical protein L2E82_06747 [Cichorium intybus]
MWTLLEISMSTRTLHGLMGPVRGPILCTHTPIPKSDRPQQRRLPTTPFQPARSVSASIPFMSFDIGSSPASISFSSPQFGSTIGGGGSSANFDNEPPLLEELGINTKQIWNKTASILNPFRVKSIESV